MITFSGHRAAGAKAEAGPREDSLRYLAASADLDEPAEPNSFRNVTFAIAAVVVVFLLWAGVANIHAVTRTIGEVAPSGSLRIVQHQSGGVVKDILVEEGQLVEQGEALVSLVGDGVIEDLRQAREKQQTLLAREERFRAFIENRDPDFSHLASSDPEYLKEQQDTYKSMLAAIVEERQVLQQQREQKQQMILTLKDQLQTVSRNEGITQEIYDRRKGLLEEGYLPRIQFLETERSLNDLAGAKKKLERDIALAETSLAEYEERLQLQQAKARDEAYVALDNITAEIALNKETIEKLVGRAKGLSVESPVRGIVKSLSVNSVGGVVASGQAIAEIVPLDEDLIIEIKIAPKDIGNVREGHVVDVKFSAYDNSQFGSVRGALTYVSATTFSGENGERFYRGKVTLEKNYVGDDPGKNVIIPGMTVMADIILGDRTLLSHMLSPARKIAGNAFKE